MSQAIPNDPQIIEKLTLELQGTPLEIQRFPRAPQSISMVSQMIPKPLAGAPNTPQNDHKSPFTRHRYPSRDVLFKMATVPTRRTAWLVLSVSKSCRSSNLASQNGGGPPGPPGDSPGDPKVPQSSPKHLQGIKNDTKSSSRHPQ